jgi:hypothetical protein
MQSKQLVSFSLRTQWVLSQPHLTPSLIPVSFEAVFKLEQVRRHFFLPKILGTIDNITFPIQHFGLASCDLRLVPWFHLTLAQIPDLAQFETNRVAGINWIWLVAVYSSSIALCHPYFVSFLTYSFNKMSHLLCPCPIRFLQSYELQLRWEQTRKMQVKNLCAILLLLFLISCSCGMPRCWYRQEMKHCTATQWPHTNDRWSTAPPNNDHALRSLTCWMKNRAGSSVATLPNLHVLKLPSCWIKFRVRNREATLVTPLLCNLHSSVYSNFAKKAILTE